MSDPSKPNAAAVSVGRWFHRKKIWDEVAALAENFRIEDQAVRQAAYVRALWGQATRWRTAFRLLTALHVILGLAAVVLSGLAGANLAFLPENTRSLLALSAALAAAVATTLTPGTLASRYEAAYRTLRLGLIRYAAESDDLADRKRNLLASVEAAMSLLGLVSEVVANPSRPSTRSESARG